MYHQYPHPTRSLRLWDLGGWEEKCAPGRVAFFKAVTRHESQSALGASGRPFDDATRTEIYSPAATGGHPG